MPSPPLIEAKRVRVTYVCPAESKLEGMNMEVEVEYLGVEAVKRLICNDGVPVLQTPCPLCSCFHEVLL